MYYIIRQGENHKICQCSLLQHIVDIITSYNCTEHFSFFPLQSLFIQLSNFTQIITNSWLYHSCHYTRYSDNPI